MNVTVRLFAMYRDDVGTKSLSVAVPDGSTVRETLQTLEASYPELSQRLLTANGETKPAVTILVNGRLIAHEGSLDTVLEDDDVLSIMPPVTGGA